MADPSAVEDDGQIEDWLALAQASDTVALLSAFEGVGFTR
jgi:hypothetical protein